MRSASENTPTATLRRKVRSLAITTLVMTASSAMLMAPPAAAQPGDRTTNYNNHGVEFATNACPGAFGQITVQGFPDSPDNYQVYFGGQDCTVRARFVGVADDNRTVVDTGYATTSNNDGFFAVANVYRCYVEFGVRRLDGTFYTRSVLPDTQESPNCPE